MKVSCTVWSGGKSGDNFKGLPITIQSPDHGGTRIPPGCPEHARHAVRNVQHHPVHPVVRRQAGDHWGRQGGGTDRLPKLCAPGPQLPDDVFQCIPHDHPRPGFLEADL